MHKAVSYKIQEISSIASIQLFNDFPSILYRNDQNWSRPLDLFIEEIFDKKRNKNLVNGDIIRWIAIDSIGKVVGRIAAFYTPDSFDQFSQPTGGIGFFDSIDDLEVSALLFSQAKKWLKSNGLEAMDGPINPGMRDSFWGCLVDGFHEPIFNMPYNFPYYQNLFENFGFKNYFNQYTYKRKFEDNYSVHPVVKRSAERIINNSDYQFSYIKKGDPKFALDFQNIYNKAWSQFSGTKNLTYQEAIDLLKSMKDVMDERLILFCYYKGEPVAFLISMPDIGQIIRKFNGKWNWINKLRFYWDFNILHKVDRVIGRIFGVIPEFQGKGVEGALILVFKNETQKPSFRYKTYELNWIGDFNPVMMKVAEIIGGSIYKTHVTYRYLFDPDKEFSRAPLVNVPGYERPVNKSNG